MKLHEFFTDNSKWTKHSYARNDAGQPCNVDSPEAESFCVRGGIAKVYGFKDGSPEEYVAVRLRMEGIENKLETYLKNNYRSNYGYGMLGWNDDPELTFEEFKKVLVAVDI